MNTRFLLATVCTLFVVAVSMIGTPAHSGHHKGYTLSTEQQSLIAAGELTVMPEIVVTAIRPVPAHVESSNGHAVAAVTHGLSSEAGARVEMMRAAIRVPIYALGKSLAHQTER